MATTLGFHGSSQLRSQLLVASVMSHLSQRSCLSFTARVASCCGRARRPLPMAGLAGSSHFGNSVDEKPPARALEASTGRIPGAFGRTIDSPRPVCLHSSRYSTLRYSTVSRDVETGEGVEKDFASESSDWKIKMLYDGECPLCMREVNMLREKNKKYAAIKFVDICADDYSAEDNNSIDFETAMGRIHVIRKNGEVLTNIAAFRALYEEVGLGWVYAITNYEPWATILDNIYEFWAKYRLPITGRPPLVEVLEKRRQKTVKGGQSGAQERCRVD